MFAEHMKRGNPWDEIPFGSSVLRGGGGSDGHNAPSASSSSGTCSSEADHFIPIKLMEQKLKNKLADKLNDMDMDFDFDPRQKLNRMDFPERFKQAEEDFRSKIQRAKNNIPPLSERLHRAGSPFRDTSHAARAHSPSPNSSSSVRHIPIIVEGKQQSTSPSTQSQQPKTSSSRNSTPPPKLDPIPMPPPPSHATEDTPATSGPKTTNATIHAEETTSEGTNATAANPTADESQSVPPPVKKPAPAATQLEKVEAISREVKQLEKQVGEFTGTSKNKDYIFLDELLTRNLIKLDNIETDGKEDVRNARKACIRLIQKCISNLEEKIAEKSKPVVETTTSLRTPPAYKTAKPNFVPPRKASSEPPYHRTEICIEVNQDEKTHSDEKKPSDEKKSSDEKNPSDKNKSSGEKKPAEEKQPAEEKPAEEEKKPSEEAKPAEKEKTTPKTKGTTKKSKKEKH